MASESSAATTADKLEGRIWKDVEAKVDDKLSAELKKLIKKGTVKQHVFKFNEHVRDEIDAAASALQQTPPAVEKALAVLQGEKLINSRQENILLAQ
jgi:Mn-dependent DtxR family transcriptional regulator